MPSKPFSARASCGLMRSTRISLSSPISRALVIGKVSTSQNGNPR